MIKYPNIEVELVGHDGNAFAILGRVKKAMRDAHLPSDKIDWFMEEATAGDYSHLLATVAQWVTVTGPEDRDEDDLSEDDEDRIWDEYWDELDASRFDADDEF